MSLVAAKINSRRSAPTDLKRKIVQESNFLGDILDQCTIKKKQRTIKKVSSTPLSKVSQDHKKSEPLMKNERIELDKPRVSSSSSKPPRRSEPLIKQSSSIKKPELPRIKVELKRNDGPSVITPDKKKQVEIERKYKRLSTDEALALLYKSKDKNKSKDENKRRSESQNRDSEPKREPIKLRLTIPKKLSPDGNAESEKRKKEEESALRVDHHHQIPSKEKKTASSPSFESSGERSSPSTNSITSHNNDLNLLFNKMNTFQRAPSFVHRPGRTTTETPQNKNNIPRRDSRGIVETNNRISPDSTSSINTSSKRIAKPAKEADISFQRVPGNNPPSISKSNPALNKPIPRNQIHTKEHHKPPSGGSLAPPPPKVEDPRLKSYRNNSVALSKSELKKLDPKNYMTLQPSTKSAPQSANIKPKPHKLNASQSTGGRSASGRRHPPPSNHYPHSSHSKSNTSTTPRHPSVRDTSHSKQVNTTPKDSIRKIAFVKPSDQVPINSSQSAKSKIAPAAKEQPVKLTTSISIIPKFETLSGSESEGEEESFIIPRLESLPQIITEMPPTPKYEDSSSSSDDDSSSDDSSSSSGSSSSSSDDSSSSDSE